MAASLVLRQQRPRAESRVGLPWQRRSWKAGVLAGNSQGTTIPPLETGGGTTSDQHKAPLQQGFPTSGRPDLNRGPHRPERCALPGCATPR